MAVVNNFEISEKDLKRFNWGAFILGWIWGLLNKSYITLIQLPILFFPILGTFISLALSIWFGIKGNSWAYKNKIFNSYDEFNCRQRKYAKAGLVIILLNVITMFLALPHFYKVLNVFSNELHFDVYAYNIANYSLNIIANINIGLVLLLLLWIIDLKKHLKSIIASLILITCFYLTLIPSFECYAEKAVSKTSYDMAINSYNKLLNIIKIYPLIKNEKELVYKEKLVYLYLMKSDLKNAIVWAENLEKKHVVYQLEENQLTSLYIFNGDYDKVINRGAKYKICMFEKDWSCAIKELTQKIENPKGGKVFGGKVYADYKFYLARAIAYRNMGNENLANKDYEIALKLNNSSDVIEAYKNYKIYYNKPEMLK